MVLTVLFNLMLNKHKITQGDKLYSQVWSDICYERNNTFKDFTIETQYTKHLTLKSHIAVVLVNYVKWNSKLKRDLPRESKFECNSMM